tara:strand:- start:6610 stop:6891 length:282 start_codon:yes stop_codon:yes gene_type:complete
MNNLYDLRVFLNRFFKRQKPREREMKRVFQLRRYLEWKDLSIEEKLTVKRLFFVPIVAFLIIELFNQNFFLIVLLLIGYVLYKKFESGSIFKK